VVGNLLGLRRLVVDGVLGRCHDLAAGYRILETALASLIRKQRVRDALLYVVRFARENSQRLVLGLPTEARHRTVIAVPVGWSGNPERLCDADVCQNCAVFNCLNQPQPESRRGDPEPEDPGKWASSCAGCEKVRLADGAPSGSIRSPGNYE